MGGSLLYIIVRAWELINYRAVELATSLQKIHTIIHSLLLPPAYGYPEENLTLTAHTR